MITKNKQKGFALVLALVLLLAMSLMGGALIVIASADHQGNNSSDEYQQTFYVAETALLQGQKSLINKMIGPINTTDGTRDIEGRYIPRNGDSDNDGVDNDPAPEQTPCFRSFRNLSRETIPPKKVKSTSSNNWQCIGPWDFDKDAASRSYAPGAAHLYTIEQSQSNSNVLYAGAATAGAWRSNNKGNRCFYRSLRH